MGGYSKGGGRVLSIIGVRRQWDCLPNLLNVLTNTTNFVVFVSTLSRLFCVCDSGALKMQDRKMTDNEILGVENAGLENDGN